MISLYIILIIIIAFYLLIPSNNMKDSSIMNHETNQGFRGILALLIVFAHVSHEYTFPLSSEGSPYGMVVVGLFFFFSGYGLLKQYIAKGEDYIDGFLMKRAKKLLPSFLFILLIASTSSLWADFQILEVGGVKLDIF